MPVSLTYPGVYIEEIPSGVHTITGVSTSTTAFIGRALKGPSNQAITINSYADFQRIYGGLWVGNYLGYVVRDFFLNGGSQAIIVRVDNTATASSAELAPSLTFVAVPKGALGNTLKVTIDLATDKDKTRFNLTITDNSNNKVVESHENLTVNSSDACCVATVLKKSPYVNVFAGMQGLPVVAPQPTEGNLIGGSSTKQAAITLPCTDKTANMLNLVAANGGVWGRNVQLIVDLNVSAAVAGSYGLQPSDLFNLTVVDTQTNTVEQYYNLTVKDSPARVDKILVNQSSLVRVLTDKDGTVTLPPNVPGPIPNSNPNVAISPTMLTNGSDGESITTADVLGDQTQKTGLYALENVGIFNLLCIPGYNTTHDVDTDVLIAAEAYCEARDAFFIIDSPSTWNSVSQAIDGMQTFANLGISSKNAAVFFPRIQQPDPLLNNQLGIFLPCGMIAGTMARIDGSRGIWKAPAGIEANLQGVTQLVVNLTDAENGELNPLGINCLRAMPAAGTVIWGSRTLQGNDALASEWKYIPVRRTALYIEQSVYRGTQWVIFEPNDESLWAQIRLNIGSFMQTLFRQGAFQGNTPQTAYFVKCDRETTTQDDINRGVVNILIGFAPVKPAEFVVIMIEQIAGQG